MITLKEWEEKAKDGVKFYTVRVASPPRNEYWESLCDRAYKVTEHKIKISDTTKRANYAMIVLPCKAGMCTLIVEMNDGGHFEGFLFKEESFWSKEEAEDFAKKQMVTRAKYEAERKELEWKKAKKKLEELEAK